MGTGSELDIPDPQRDHFGHPQAGLQHHGQDGPVAPAEPQGRIGGAEKRIDFVTKKEIDDTLLVAFGGHRQDFLTMKEQLGFGVR
ncbi:hypothetical protein JMM59_17305 [Rhodovulum sulfidophilum]|nr:hypothetical protein [Rhodovulum sulfidophilum]